MVGPPPSSEGAGPSKGKEKEPEDKAPNTAEFDKLLSREAAAFQRDMEVRVSTRSTSYSWLIFRRLNVS